MSPSTLLVKPGVSLIQNYQIFFSIPQGPQRGLASGARIKLQGPSGVIQSGVVETFDLPELALGAVVPVMGSTGGRLVVQLAYPVDVVFFERLDTTSTTERLAARLSEKGYAPRLNLNSARLPGQYNVIYAGDQVPLSSLKQVVTIASENGVHFRSIQPQLHLKNGVQNQIQIGSSLSAACLSPISETTLRMLSQASSEQEILTILRDLPAATCSSG